MLVKHKVDRCKSLMNFELEEDQIQATEERVKKEEILIKRLLKATDMTGAISEI